MTAVSENIETKDPLAVFRDSMNLSSFIAGSIAGASGVIVGHPFDSLKVRMQVGQNLKISGWNAEVLRQLYRGVMPPLMTVGVVAAINFATYESFKSLLKSRHFNSTTDEHQRTPLSHIFLAGCLSGFAMVACTSPMGVVKVQLQVAKQMSFFECIRGIWRQQGIAGFYRGFPLSIIMDVPGRGVYLWTYETVKAFCLNQSEFPRYAVQNQGPDSYPLHLRAISASVAGIFSWIVIYPFDVIKARVQLDIGRQKYKSTWHCIAETWREGGVKSFFRGLSYTVLRAGPVAATILPIYDLSKSYLDRNFYPSNVHTGSNVGKSILVASNQLLEEESNCNATTSVR